MLQNKISKKNKNILLNYSAFRKNYLAGVAVYSKEMLSEIVKKDNVNKYTIILNKEVKEYFGVKNLDNIDVIELTDLCKKPFIRILFEIFILPFIVLTRKVDLIFTPYVSTSIFSSCKKITVIHDIMPLIIKKYSMIRQYFVRLMMFVSMKFADRIVTVSQSSMNDLKKHYPRFQDKVSFIHNGVRKTFCVTDSFKLNNTYNYKYILFVGTLQPSKNLLRLIEAYGLIKNKIEENLVIIGGRGWQIADKLQLLINKYKLQDRIVFSGYVEQSELITLYCNATFLAYPSLYEGFGFPPLEAMQCGTAVLASNIASIPEVCGNAALYVNPYSIKDISEKITLLCNDKKLVDNLVKRGFEQVNKFDWENSADKMLKIFYDLIQ